MTGCQYNHTNGCAGCPARQACELSFDEREARARHLAEPKRRRIDWFAVAFYANAVAAAGAVAIFITAWSNA